MKRFLASICLFSVMLAGCVLSSDIEITETDFLVEPGSESTPSQQAGETAETPADGSPLTSQETPSNEAGLDWGQPIAGISSADIDSIDAWVEEKLSSMTLEQKVGQMILTGLEGTEVTEETCQYIQDLMPGGVTFQHGNILDPDQLSKFVRDLQECGQVSQSVPMFMTLSHEGEYVHRYMGGTTLFPTALALGATGDPGVAYQMAYASGQELAYSGINMVLGPVADVLDNFDNEVISERTYGGDQQSVSQYVAQAVNGYRQAGVIPVLKHFPGHGGVAQDSHQVLPIDPADINTLQAQYLPPFQAGLAAGAPVLMLSHIAFPAIAGGEVPSTLSPEMIDYIREDMEFEGVIMSDSLRMKSVTANKTISTQEIAVEAAIAGDDMLLLNWDEHAKLAKEFLLAAIGRGDLSEARVDDAVRRILTLKAAWELSEYRPVDEPEPNWQSNQALSHQIGKRAVTLLSDDAELVPIPQTVKRIMIIGPETEWEFYPVLEAALNQRGIETNLATYPPPWEGPVAQAEALDTLPGLSQYYDLTLVFTWQVHLNQLKYDDHWQAELVRRLAGGPLIVVAIRSPTDILEFPNVPTYLMMYGSTSGQTEALLDILLGKQAAQGVNPLPGLLDR